MAWDTNLPADTTKIRDLGVVIRANNTAIAGGDTSLAPPRWNISNSGGVPPASASMVRIYGDNDSAGNAQIFTIDPSSNKSRITSTPIVSSEPIVTITSPASTTAQIKYDKTYKIFTQGHFTVSGTSYPLFEIIGYLEVQNSNIITSGTFTINWPFPFQANYPISVLVNQANGTLSGDFRTVSFTNTQLTFRSTGGGTLISGAKIFLRVLGV